MARNGLPFAFMSTLDFENLPGHDRPLMGIHALENAPELLSMDSGGTIKLWDLSVGFCVEDSLCFPSMALDIPGGG